MRISLYFSRLAVTLASLIFLVACGNNNPAGVSRLHLLTNGNSKTWHMVLDTSYTGTASNPCLMDNQYVFSASGEFVNIDDGVRCSEDEADRRITLAWALDSDSTILTFNGISAMHITSLTDSMMVVEEVSRADNNVVRKTVFRAEKK